ncbi:MAG: alcohol dehydrogenase catalytic domain-containing protein, partial [Phycisphaeraceae bacterium]
MQALVYDGKKVSLQTNRPDPKLVPTEALIKPLRMGLCATDLEICRGYLGFQGVLGHEFVGKVQAVGSQADKA